MEFAPLDFFPTFNTPTMESSEFIPELELVKDDIESSASTFHDEENRSVSELS